MAAPNQLIEECHAADDRLPSLPELLQFGGASGEYEPGDVHQKSNIFIPPVLIESFNKLKVKMFMGIFPEINRAWFTVDNRLYLWNYCAENDFSVYDGLDQIIISAAVVTPKPDVFVDEIKHLLVLATPVEVVMLALVFEGGDTTKEVRIHPTKFAIPTDNVNMLKIVGTKNGRIFMGGSDGSINEIQYQAEEGWFARKCRKLTYNKSVSILGSVLSLFTGRGSEHPIIDIVVDDAANVLYTLSSNNSIEVYSLGHNGQQFQQLCSISHITDEVVKFAPGLAGDKALATTVVNIFAISSECNNAQLLAVTKGGLRLYFQLTQRTDTSARLILSHVRYAPGRDATGRPSGAIIPIHASYYNRGVMLLSSSKDQAQGDAVVVAYSDIPHLIHKTGSPERAATVDVEGKVWSISEIPIAQLAGSSLYNLVSHVRNELATQHLAPPRQFVLLSSNGIKVLSKLRPVDRLRDILVASRGADTQELRHFFQQYGPDQACAMCLMLACSETRSAVVSPRIGASPTTALSWHDPDVASWATQVFFRMGGRPSYPPPQNQYQARTFSPSFCAAGFCLYLSRILRPVWQMTMFTSTGSGIACKLKKEQISQLEMQLLALKKFLANNPYWAPVNPAGAPSQHPSSNVHMMMLDMQRRRIDDEARKTEQRNLADLHLLLLRSIEVISFIDILCENNLKAISAKIPKNATVRILQTRFKDFVTHTEADVSKDLVNALIASCGDETKLEIITTELRQRCPSFFSDADRTRLKAMDIIQKVKTTLSTDEQHRLLEQSLEMFLSIPQHVNQQPNLLRQICEVYRRYHFYEGVVILCLKCAEAADPNGVGLVWFKEGKRPTDENGKLAHDARMHIYEFIISVLDELLAGPNAAPAVEIDPLSGATSRPPPVSAQDWEQFKARTMKAALKSNDELFHVTLYTWYLERGLADELTLLKTPFIENFLLKHCEDKLLSKQLLWKYYYRLGNRIRAAQILVQLAEHKGSELTLQDRLEHLSQALGIAQEQGTDHQLLRDIQERIEVASIQLQIFQDLNRVADEELRRQAQWQLDQELFSNNDLYHRFAKKFGLCEAALHIVHVSGYSDIQLVRRLWENLLQDELDKGQHLNKIEPLAKKIRDLVQRFYPSDAVLPLDVLIDMFERISLEARNIADWHHGWVAKSFIDGGVPSATLKQIYTDLSEGRLPGSSFWASKRENQEHLKSVIQYLSAR